MPQTVGVPVQGESGGGIPRRYLYIGAGVLALVAVVLLSGKKGGSGGSDATGLVDVNAATAMGDLQFELRNQTGALSLALQKLSEDNDSALSGLSGQLGLFGDSLTGLSDQLGQVGGNLSSQLSGVSSAVEGARQQEATNAGLLLEQGNWSRDWLTQRIGDLLQHSEFSRRYLAGEITSDPFVGQAA